MRLDGARDLPAEPGRVWRVLADPAVLTDVVGHADAVEPGPPLRITATWGVAMLEGVYRAEVDVAEADEPRTASLRLAVRGKPGSVDATVEATLEDQAGATRLSWTVDYEASGRLARIGSGVLDAALRRYVDALLDGVEAHLLGAAPGAGDPPVMEQAGAGTPAPGTPGPTGRVPSAAWGPTEPGSAAPVAGRLVLAGLAGGLVVLAVAWVLRRARA